MATRDAGARRRLADQVREVIESAPIARTDELAAAASAVVLASDLRAPVPHGPGAWGEHDAMPAAIFPHRQGWRARLANVERLLVKCIENQDGDWMHGSYPPLEEALAEIRAMIDGDGE
jgi:hypothetical protein